MNTVNGMTQEELDAAAAALPTGYALVKVGVVAPGDMLWNFVDRRWMSVRTPKQFRPGQMRHDEDDTIEIGRDVSDFFAVARPQL